MLKTHRNGKGELLVCIYAGPFDPPSFEQSPESYHTVEEYSALADELATASYRDRFTDADAQRIWDNWQAKGSKPEQQPKSDDPAQIERATREMQRLQQIDAEDTSDLARAELPDPAEVYARWNGASRRGQSDV